jgi:serine/threonine protein kinase
MCTQCDSLCGMCRGRFGNVYRCRALGAPQSRDYAAKWLRADKKRDRENIEREVAILSRMHHPTIVRLCDAFDHGPLHADMILVMEMYARVHCPMFERWCVSRVDGGELFERIADKHFVLTETAIAMVVSQVCDAIRYVHSMNVVHLDVKVGTAHDSPIFTPALSRRRLCSSHDTAIASS